MSFRNNIENDIQNISFNTDHFAENALYYKANLNYSDATSNLPIPIVVVFYPDAIKNNYGESMSSEIGDYTLYIKKNNYTIVDNVEINNIIDCEIGDYVEIDNKFYTIIVIREETIGSWTCGAMSREINRKTSNYRSYRA